MEEQNQQEMAQEQVEQAAPQEHNEQSSEAQKHDDREQNFAALREARLKAERERDEYMQRLKAYEQEQEKKAQKQEQPDEDQMDPSDLVEWRHVQKEINKLKSELNSYQQQTSQSTTEARLKAQHPDIDQVLTQDNIARLAQEDPDLAEIINDTSDLYRKATVAYKYIKKMGIYNDKNFDKEKQTIAENQAKPRSSSSSSASASALSEAKDYMERSSADYKKQLYREMLAAAENL